MYNLHKRKKRDYGEKMEKAQNSTNSHLAIWGILALISIGVHYLSNFLQTYTPKNTSLTNIVTSETTTPRQTLPCPNETRIPYNAEHWKKYPLENKSLDKNDIDDPFTVNQFAFVSQDKVWAATNYELMLLENGQSNTIDMRSYLQFQKVRKVKVAPDGKIWMTYEFQNTNQISSWDEKKVWKNYTFPGKVKDLAISKDGTIWVAYSASDSTLAGISYFKYNNWHNLKMWDKIEEGNTIYAIVVARDGSVWVETELMLFRWFNNYWENHVIESEFVCRQYAGGEHFLTEGPDGTIWGSYGLNIFHFDGKAWNNYFMSNDPLFDLGGLAISNDETIWAGGGFYKDGKSYYFEKLPFSKAFTIQVAPDGSIWYGTYSGIYIYDNKEY